MWFPHQTHQVLGYAEDGAQWLVNVVGQHLK